MTTTKSAINSNLGINFNRVDVGNTVAGALAQFRVGAAVNDDNGGRWIYGQVAPNSTASVQGNVFHIIGSGAAVMATTTLALFGMFLGIPAVAIPLDATNYQYAWFQTHGQCEGIRVAASCVQRVRLNTTATAGLLDDDATSGSKTCDGVTIDTTDASAATSTVAGILSNARVGTTL